jgi:hypothetical protein
MSRTIALIGQVVYVPIEWHATVFVKQKASSVVELTIALLVLQK